MDWKEKIRSQQVLVKASSIQFSLLKFTSMQFTYFPDNFRITLQKTEYLNIFKSAIFQNQQVPHRWRKAFVETIPKNTITDFFRFWNILFFRSGNTYIHNRLRWHISITLVLSVSKKVVSRTKRIGQGVSSAYKKILSFFIF